MKTNILLAASSSILAVIACDVYATDASGIVFIPVFYGIAPGLVFGIVGGLMRKRGYFISLSLSLLIPLVVSYLLVCSSCKISTLAGVWSVVEGYFGTLPYLVIPAIVMHALSYWSVVGLKRLIKSKLMAGGIDA